MDVIDVAKWFIKNDYDEPRNTIDGNMKLQKLLYFSQLVHLAKYGDKLFDEPINAFVNGSVVEKVRLKYRDDHRQFVQESKSFEDDLDETIQYTLSVVKDVFGDVDARELSNLNHLHVGWKEALEKSEISKGKYYKPLSIISYDTIMEHDIESIKKVLDAHESTIDSGKTFELINGVKFYYDPEEISFDDDLLEQLASFQGEESAYIVHMDEDGLVFY
ncbi:Uncharacterized phage-associated protein [Paenibacillus sophorae]|uniref:DUF4065 domain-containing protein n=1 Tax=Paenibacillus sophorae TaxID=1333845 RepID=A0A1H8H5W8_9BACL|nr:type II toxin-antitoxin system antitoxin SocA domain-containing protein [Paenibacillus sophorae]QWU14454.1 DUF4065 domain-containing protein [Paenibacillus sophorae]SEN51636.1 Uncharacterized phage-associated protein [Paenibacillus sophorae]